MPPPKTKRRRRRVAGVVGPRGRKFGPTIREAILTQLAKGASCRMAAELSGIDPRTLKTWRAKGRDSLAKIIQWETQGEPEDERPKLDAFGRFELDVAHARAYADLVPMSTLQLAAKTDWRAALALLQMRRPEEFGEVVTTRLAEMDGDGERVDVTERLLAKLALQAKRVREDKT